MSFAGLVFHNVWTKKLRSLLTAFAVAVGVLAVIALGLVTGSLKTTAASILQTGKADFTVAQRGASDILLSSMTSRQLERIQGTPGVKSAVGVLLDTEKLNADNPLFVEIGIAPNDLSTFGVDVIRGRRYNANAKDEMMLGWRIADDLGLQPGDTLDVAGGKKTITGIFSTGNVFGDSAGMFPLVPFQAYERQPQGYTLAFVRVQPGANAKTVADRVSSDAPGLATIRSLADFGRADRNYELITAADRGATIVAVLIGAFVVMNTMLLSLVERTREFGILRSIGWTARRIVSLIMGEALLISVVGAAIGVGLAVGLVSVLARLHKMQGILHPDYTAGTFVRALIVAAAVAFLGALYPAIRASLLSPMAALRRE
jgi:putative ABC transport system permease protein